MQWSASRDYHEMQKLIQLAELGGRNFSLFSRSKPSADALANIGVDLSGDFVFFNEPPREVLLFLHEDKVEAKFPRLVVNQ